VERAKPPRRQPEQKTAFASQQKKNASEAERRLWAILRRKQIAGEPFKRSEPIGPHLVSFYCPGAKLVILLDDGLPDAGALTALAQWLTAHGYQVERLKAEDVRRTPWPIFNRIARAYRLQDLPRGGDRRWQTGPSNQS
jgi:very-short-patch-repair endonuclease